MYGTMYVMRIRSPKACALRVLPFFDTQNLQHWLEKKYVARAAAPRSSWKKQRKFSNSVQIHQEVLLITVYFILMIEQDSTELLL